MSGSLAEPQHTLIYNKTMNALEVAKTSPHIFACLIFFNVSKMSEVICMGRAGTVMHGFK